MKPTTIPEERQSQNKTFGFYGTFKCNYKTSDQETDKAFDQAVTVIMECLKIPAGVARRLLDSRWGRHAADQVSKPETLKYYINKSTRTKSGRLILKEYLDCARQADAEFYGC
jgi:hypothetical protein